MNDSKPNENYDIVLAGKPEVNDCFDLKLKSKEKKVAKLNKVTDFVLKYYLLIS